MRRCARLLGAVSFFLIVVAAGHSQAGPLNPFDFSPLGALGPGTYIIDSGGQLTGGVPTIYAPTAMGLTALASGVVSNGIAVFDYTSVHFDASSQFLVDDRSVFQPSGFGNNPFASRPVALLSQGDEFLGGSINVAPSARGGMGEGGMGQFFQTPYLSILTGGGGGGFGTAGNPGEPVPNPNYVPGGAGGAIYGDLSQRLQQGSQGGYNGGYLAYGGGAIELGAAGSTTISGTISAVGGSGNSFPADTGNGGGSGGAIYVHASLINLVNSNAFSVLGGKGGPPGGSEHAEVLGGGDGGLGRILLQGNVIPEPPSLVLSGLAGLTGLAVAIRRRGRDVRA